MSVDAVTLQAIEDAVERAFSSGVSDKRYLDISRVPLICQSINSLAKNMEELKDSLREISKPNDNLVTQDQFAPVKIIAYGLVSTTMVAVLGALLMLVLRT